MEILNTEKLKRKLFILGSSYSGMGAELKGKPYPYDTFIIGLKKLRKTMEEKDLKYISLDLGNDGLEEDEIIIPVRWTDFSKVP